MSKVALFFEKMHKVFKNKAQGCSSPLNNMQKAFLQHQVDLSAMSSVGVASVKALKAIFLPIPQYVHMCRILFNSEIPYVLQLSMSQDGHIIGFSTVFLLLSPVPISMVV